MRLLCHATHWLAPPTRHSPTPHTPESLARSQLEALAAAQIPGAVLTPHAEVLHMSLPVAQGNEPADCFFFGAWCFEGRASVRGCGARQCMQRAVARAAHTL
jgi:hypothetical protein